jgi:hypothetical protein
MISRKEAEEFLKLNGALNTVNDSVIHGKKITSEFRLVGLSRPHVATLWPIDSDEPTIWATIEMKQDRINALWKYCKDHWAEKKIAIVRHSGFNDNGLPINPVMIGIREVE